MEEKKTLKIKKTYLIIFALAIAFAIMGFIDLKVNAADGYAVNVQYITRGYNGSGNEIETRTTDLGSIVSTAPIDAYYYTSYDKPVATTHKYTVFLVSEQPMTDNDVQTTLNGTTVYICMFGPVNAGLYYDGGGYLEPLISGNRYSYDLNTDYSDISAFTTALSSNTLDCEQIIDYSKLEVDDTMPYVDDIYGNRLCFETLPDYAYYDYFTWKNNTTFQVQVERTPIAHFYKGYQNRNLVKAEYMGFVSYKILDSGTSKLNNISDVARFHQQYSGEYEWYRNVIDTANYDYDYVKLGFGYRLRYIDISSQKASLWIYIIPTYAVGEVGQGYLKYFQYADGSLSDYMDITGLQKSWNVFDSNKLESIEDVENYIDRIIQYVDNRNEFKDEFGVGDNVSILPPSSSGSIGNYNGNIVTDVDVEDATTWLHSVATFIKGTPSFIGSVISFLPEPIRYGMYVCLFLGVIASGYAIVKALI